MTWDILDDTTLVAPLTTIKGLGEKAIEQILANRPFTNAEELLFNENVVYSKHRIAYWLKDPSVYSRTYDIC